jgi:membrane AbrB-like protein
MRSPRLTGWPVVVLAVVATGEAARRIGLPAAYLFAAFVVGIAYALLPRRQLAVPTPSLWVAQGVIGVSAGAYLQRSTLERVQTHALAVAAFCVLAIALSVLAGMILANLTPIDPATAAFGMIAGGAVGIISMSRQLGADDRLVAALQYTRVLIIVALSPLVAIGIFDIQRAPASGPGHGPGTLHALPFLVACLTLGGVATRLLRIRAGAILGAMIVAAAVSLIDRSLAAQPPVAVVDCAFVVVGLDVGLRFTRLALREAGSVLVRGIVAILAIVVVSAGLGVALAYTAHVSQLDGYLATTPGGLSTVLALSIGNRTNTGFIVSVQVIRTFLMLLAAPPLAAWLASRPARSARTL